MDSEALRARLAAAADHEDWVRAVAEYWRAGGAFFGHGTDNAEDEAFWLIRHLQDWRDERWHAPPDPDVADAVLGIAERRIAERKPLAYLLGEAWFAGLPFFVDENVLVPRSPLAEVVERCFAPWIELRAGDRVLDVGTGSGCIAIAVAHYCGVDVDATDIEQAALAVAARNVARHGLDGRVHLHADDLFPETGGGYRVIISNPPYVGEREMATLPAEYRREPAVGLAAGDHGLEAVERLLRGAPARLAGDGALIVEVGAGAEALAARHPRLPAMWLEFERGGEGVLLVTAAELDAYFGKA